MAAEPTSHPTPPHPTNPPGPEEITPVPSVPPARADISPGRPGLSPLPFPKGEWDSFALSQLPNDTSARQIYDLGAADAAAWVRQVGLLQAAASATG